MQPASRPLYRQDIGSYSLYLGKCIPFLGIKKSGTAEISGLSSLMQRDEGLFLLPAAPSNQAYKRTKDKVKEKTHAEFLRRNYQ